MFRVESVNSVEDVVSILQQLYASEVVAAQQYYKHAMDVRGVLTIQMADLFKQHAEEENGHAEKLRAQIDNLGGTILNKMEELMKLNPVPRGESGDVQSSLVLRTMLEQDLKAEENAIAAYTLACRLIRDFDPGTFLVLAGILNEEYEHRTDFVNLLASAG